MFPIRARFYARSQELSASFSLSGYRGEAAGVFRSEEKHE